MADTKTTDAQTSSIGRSSSINDQTMIRPPDLDVPTEDQALIAELMSVHGFDQLKKTQAFAFNNGILDEGSNLLVAETGNGKTLTAEAKTLKHLKQGNRVAYLVPSRQLVWDKKETIEEWAEPDYSVFTGQGKYRSADVAVGTFESFYQAMLRGVDGVRSIDLIVLDDFHELYSDYRGSAISLSIAASRYEDIELYGISATIGNPDEIAEWMGGEALISPEERQTPIEEHAINASSSSTKQAVVDTVQDNIDKGPFLVFCFAKSWTESRARALADADLFDGPSRDRDLRSELSDKVNGVLTNTHREILSILRSGVGYIHADLPGNIKKYILDLYEEGEIQALTTTTSLAYGFDSPVQTVVVADIKRRGEYVGVHEYVQWAGRAARPRFNYPTGYCYTLTDDPEETEERFFEPHRELEDIQNHIDDEEQFRWLVLELIANGWRSTEQIQDFIKQTLYYHQMSTGSGWGRREPKSKEERLTERLDETAEWLIDNGFINGNDTRSAFQTTHLGRGAVNFHYNSWIDTDLLNIKAFYNWIENADIDDINQLDYLHQVVSNFDITLGAKDANGRLEPVLRDYGYNVNEEGVTAGLIRWYWMRNYSTERIEQETEIDPTYIPGTARTLSDTVDASSHIVEAAPNGRLPEWHENLVFRVEKGVQEDSGPLVAEIDGMGRDRIRNLRGYLQQMAKQTLDIDPNRAIWTLLVEFKNHTDTKSQFEGILKDQVTSIGEVTASNISEFIQDNDLSGDAVTTDEEYALEVGANAEAPTSEVEADTEQSKPTSLTDF